MDPNFKTACFIAAARENATDMLADPLESPVAVARYLDNVLETLQTEYGFADPRGSHIQALEPADGALAESR